MPHKPAPSTSSTSLSSSSSSSSKGPMSMADKVHKAEELKLEGNEAFKAGNLKLAKKKYLSIFLYIKGLVRRDGSDPMHGFFSAMGANANYGSNEITDLELDSKVKNLTRDANTNLSLVFAKLENWEKSLKHANDALQMGKTVKALVRKGSALKEMKDFDQAQLVFTEALVMEPESAVVKKLMLETVKAKKAAAKEQDKIDGAIFAGAFGKK